MHYHYILIIHYHSWLLLMIRWYYHCYCHYWYTLLIHLIPCHDWYYHWYYCGNKWYCQYVTIDDPLLKYWGIHSIYLVELPGESRFWSAIDEPFLIQILMTSCMADYSTIDSHLIHPLFNQVICIHYSTIDSPVVLSCFPSFAASRWQRINCSAEATRSPWPKAATP